MKRKIKFRAWDKKTKSMIKEVYEIGLGNRNNPEKWLVGDDRQTDNFELMQYTGLKDKNGKEIYEGDILRCYFDKNQIADWLYLHFSDKVLEQGFFDEIVEIPEIYTKSFPENIEVLGNIYENPELLENEYKK